MAEGVVRGDEVPFLATVFDHRGSGTDRQRMGVINIVNAVGTALLLSEGGGASAGIHGDDFLVCGQALYR